MINPFVGRGSLLVASAAGGGLFPLCGQAEISIRNTEDNESIQDARNGVIELVEWYAVNRRLAIEATCYDLTEEALSLLLKANAFPIASDSADVVLPEGIVVGQLYQLYPKATGVTVKDANNVTVPADNYELDDTYGLIKFLSVAGYLQPFTVQGTWGVRTDITLNASTSQEVRALFTGVNRFTGQAVLIELYRLAVDISEEFRFVKKGFTGLNVRAHALPDMSANADAELGRYGRITLL